MFGPLANKILNILILARWCLIIVSVVCCLCRDPGSHGNKRQRVLRHVLTLPLSLDDCPECNCSSCNQDYDCGTQLLGRLIYFKCACPLSKLVYWQSQGVSINQAKFNQQDEKIWDEEGL